MLQFPAGFFKEETRDGFYIEGMMKCAWAAQLEVLEAFRELCEKHEIRYFADGGTLLGAIRHKGFIPWDDDVDVCMMRPEYERFLAIADKELPEPYYTYSIYSNEQCDMPFARMLNAKTVSYSEERLSKFHGFPYIAGIDIFPLDVISEDKEVQKLQCDIFCELRSNAHDYQEHQDEVMARLPEIEEMYEMHFDRSKSIPNQLLRAADMISGLFNYTDASNVVNMAYYVNNPLCLNRDWYHDVIWMPFENVMIPAPVGYEKVLTAWYGEDYMIPKCQMNHDYPFYKKQNDRLVEELTRQFLERQGMTDEINKEQNEG